MINPQEAPRGFITWGVDGHGVKWFLCCKCDKELGNSKEIDHYDIKHKCKEDNNED